MRLLTRVITSGESCMLMSSGMISAKSPHSHSLPHFVQLPVLFPLLASYQRHPFEPSRDWTRSMRKLEMTFFINSFFSIACQAQTIQFVTWHVAVFTLLPSGLEVTACLRY